MKKIFICLIFLICQASFAQLNLNEPVTFGIKAGINFSNMDFSQGSPPPEEPRSTNWQPGFMTGFMVSIPLSSKFYFQPEYLFSQMGGKIKEQNQQYKINYLSLPVFLRWQPLAKFSFLAGPQFDIFINGNAEMENNSNSIEHIIEHRSIGITGGLEFSLLNNVALSVRYMQGFNHIGINQGDGVEEFKFKMFQFSAIYNVF